MKKGKADFDHRSFWLGDLVVVYVEKTNAQKKAIRVEVQFAAIKNLECLSHELKKDFTAIEPFEKDLLIVFEKIDLIEETTLGTYIIESF